MDADISVEAVVDHQSGSRASVTGLAPTGIPTRDAETACAGAPSLCWRGELARPGNQREMAARSGRAGFRSGDRLAAPAAENRDVQKHRARPYWPGRAPACRRN